MGQKTSATSLFRQPLGARAATAFLSGAATTDALSSDEPPAAHASQRDDSDSSTHR